MLHQAPIPSLDMDGQRMRYAHHEMIRAARTYGYGKIAVLKAEPDVRASRLLLTELVSRVLRAGLALLGIEVLERM